MNNIIYLIKSFAKIYTNYVHSPLLIYYFNNPLNKGCDVSLAWLVLDEAILPLVIIISGFLPIISLIIHSRTFPKIKVKLINLQITASILFLYLNWNWKQDLPISNLVVHLSFLMIFQPSLDGSSITKSVLSANIDVISSFDSLAKSNLCFLKYSFSTFLGPSLVSILAPY